MLPCSIIRKIITVELENPSRLAFFLGGRGGGLGINIEPVKRIQMLVNIDQSQVLYPIDNILNKVRDI